MTSEPGLHHVVFRWSAENAGMGPVAASCSRSTAADAYALAGPTLWLPGAQERATLSLLAHGPRRMLVRQVPVIEPNGRPGARCHAVLGDAVDLKPLFCLGLHEWSWPGAGLPLGEVLGPLPMLDADGLRAASAAALKDLKRDVPAATDMLIAVAAEILRQPSRPLCVLDRSAGRDPLLVLIGITELFSRVVGGPWSFSTGAARAYRRFRFVFVPRWRTSAAPNAHQTELDPAVRVGDRAEELAHHLVERYGTGQEISESMLRRLVGRPVASERDDARGASRPSPAVHADPPIRPSATASPIPAGPPVPAGPLRPAGSQAPAAASMTDLPGDRVVASSAESSAAVPPNRLPAARWVTRSAPALVVRQPRAARRWMIDARGAFRIRPQTPAERREALLDELAEVCGTSAADGVGRRAEQVLSEIDDLTLLAGFGRLSSATAIQELTCELAHRAEGWTTRERRDVAETVLHNALYLWRPSGDGVHGTIRRWRVEAAVDLFDLTVRPRTRTLPPVLLEEFVEALCSHSYGRVVLAALLADPRPLALPERAWRAWVRLASRPGTR